MRTFEVRRNSGGGRKNGRNGVGGKGKRWVGRKEFEIMVHCGKGGESLRKRCEQGGGGGLEARGNTE